MLRSKFAGPLEHQPFEQFRLPALVVDVGRYPDPLDDRAGFVAQRGSSNQVPAVCAVGAALQSVLDFQPFSVLYGFRPPRGFGLPLGRVNHLKPPPTAGLFVGQAGVIEPALIEIMNGPAGIRHPDFLGDRLGQQPESLLAPPEFFLGLFLVVNVGASAEPADDRA